MILKYAIILTFLLTFNILTVSAETAKMLVENTKLHPVGWLTEPLSPRRVSKIKGNLASHQEWNGKTLRTNA